jgi:hypothetical protein
MDSCRNEYVPAEVYCGELHHKGGSSERFSLLTFRNTGTLPVTVNNQFVAGTGGNPY